MQVRDVQAGLQEKTLALPPPFKLARHSLYYQG